MTVTTPDAFDHPARNHARTAARDTIGARFRTAGKRYVAAREAAVHEDMITGRYGPEAAAARRNVDAPVS